LFEDVLAVGVVGFVVLGVGGLIYKLLSPEGWVSGWLDHLWAKSLGLVWLAGFGGAILVIALKPRYDRTPHGSGRGNPVVYAFLALGLFFFFKPVITGTL